MIIYNSSDKKNGFVHPSKGNQTKLNLGDLWYKVDHLGYEGAAEVAVSDILSRSNISHFIEYSLETIEYNGNTRKGCISKDFLKEGQDIVYLEDMFFKATGMSSQKILKNLSTRERIEFTVNLVQEMTGLMDFGSYLTTLLELDALVLNEDRHMFNIAVLKNDDGSYDYCPIFDNGASFFSDTYHDYPLEKSFGNCLKTVKAKPFSTDFDKQLKIATELYGKNLYIPNIELSEKAKTAIKESYGPEILLRIGNVINYCKAKYPDIRDPKPFPDWENDLIKQ